MINSLLYCKTTYRERQMKFTYEIYNEISHIKKPNTIRVNHLAKWLTLKNIIKIWVILPT